MIALVEEKRAEIEKLCREYAVTRLELFGSAARGDDFDEGHQSDLDFLAEFVRPIPMGSSKQYFGFKFALEDIFHRNVDVVELHCVTNSYVRKSILASKQLIYEA